MSEKVKEADDRAVKAIALTGIAAKQAGKDPEKAMRDLAKFLGVDVKQ